MPTNTDVTLVGTSILDINNFSVSIGSLAGPGTSQVLLGSGTLTTGTKNSSTVYNGVIGGAMGNLIKTGTGVFTLTATQTYTGATTVSGGTLALSGATGSIATSSGVNLSVAAAKLDISATTAGATVKDLSGIAGTVVELGARTLTAGTAVDTVFSGVMQGTGGFVKQGAGKITFAGANTFTGATALNVGQLWLSGAGSISGSSGITLAAMTTFDISMTAAGATIKDLSSAAADSILNLGGKTLTLGTTNSTTFAGLIQGAGGAIVKNGTGMLTLSHSNTYTGGNTFNDGIVSISATNALGTSTATLLFNSGSLQATNTITIPNGANLMSNGTIDVTAANILTMTGVMNGAGNVIKNGTGTLQLSAANLYTGTTTVNAGTLKANFANALPTNTDVTLVGTSTLDITNFSVSIGSLAGPGTSQVLLGSGTLTTGTKNSSAVYNGVIGGAMGNLIKTGTGVFTLTATQTYTGATTVSGGTLALSGATGSIATSSGVNLSVAAAKLDISATTAGATVKDLSGVAGTVVELGARTLTAGTGTDTVFSGVMQGTGGFVKQGAGKITFAGANTFTGAIALNVGQLWLSGAGSISGSSGITLAAMTTFDISMTAAGATIKDLSSAAADSILNLGGKTLTLGTGNSTTFAGLIQGVGGAIVKNGTGMLTLSHSNTYTGGNTFNDGIVSISATNALGSSTATLLFNRGSLQATNTITIPNTADLMADGTIDVTGVNVLTMTGVISGAGNLIKNGTGTLELSAANLYTGATTVNDGTLKASFADEYRRDVGGCDLCFGYHEL